MKIVKGFLKLLLLLLVVFLATGLLVKETSYEVKTSVNKPLSTVFRIFNDQSKLKDWLPEVKSIEPIDVKPGMIGSTYKMIVENEGDLTEMKEKVLAYIPNEKVTLHFDADDMLKTDDYNFSELNGVTTITNTVIYKSDSYLTQCLFPYLKGVFSNIDQKYLENFKVYIEKQ